jgi:hypothetical protein
MSGGVGEPRHENGSPEHRIMVCHLFFFLIGDSATTIQGKLQQAFGNDPMSTI